MPKGKSDKRRKHRNANNEIRKRKITITSDKMEESEKKELPHSQENEDNTRSCGNASEAAPGTENESDTYMKLITWSRHVKNDGTTREEMTEKETTGKGTSERCYVRTYNNSSRNEPNTSTEEIVTTTVCVRRGKPPQTEDANCSSSTSSVLPSGFPSIFTGFNFTPNRPVGLENVTINCHNCMSSDPRDITCNDFENVLREILKLQPFTPINVSSSDISFQSLAPIFRPPANTLVPSNETSPTPIQTSPTESTPPEASKSSPKSKLRFPQEVNKEATQKKPETKLTVVHTEPLVTRYNTRNSCTNQSKNAPAVHQLDSRKPDERKHLRSTRSSCSVARDVSLENKQPRDAITSIKTSPSVQISKTGDKELSNTGKEKMAGALESCASDISPCESNESVTTESCKESPGNGVSRVVSDLNPRALTRLSHGVPVNQESIKPREVIPRKCKITSATPPIIRIRESKPNIDNKKKRGRPKKAKIEQINADSEISCGTITRSEGKSNGRSLPKNEEKKERAQRTSCRESHLHAGQFQACREDGRTFIQGEGRWICQTQTASGGFKFMVVTTDKKRKGRRTSEHSGLQLRSGLRLALDSGKRYELRSKFGSKKKLQFRNQTKHPSRKHRERKKILGDSNIHRKLRRRRKKSSCKRLLRSSSNRSLTKNSFFFPLKEVQVRNKSRHPSRKRRKEMMISADSDIIRKLQRSKKQLCKRVPRSGANQSLTKYANTFPLEEIQVRSQSKHLSRKRTEVMMISADTEVHRKLLRRGQELLCKRLLRSASNRSLTQNSDIFPLIDNTNKDLNKADKDVNNEIEDNFSCSSEIQFRNPTKHPSRKRKEGLLILDDSDVHKKMLRRRTKSLSERQGPLQTISTENSDTSLLEDDKNEDLNKDDKDVSNEIEDDLSCSPEIQVSHQFKHLSRKSVEVTMISTDSNVHRKLQRKRKESLSGRPLQTISTENSDTSLLEVLDDKNKDLDSVDEGVINEIVDDFVCSPEELELNLELSSCSASSQETDTSSSSASGQVTQSTRCAENPPPALIPVVSLEQLVIPPTHKDTGDSSDSSSNELTQEDSDTNRDSQDDLLPGETQRDARARRRRETSTDGAPVVCLEAPAPLAASEDPSGAPEGQELPKEGCAEGTSDFGDSMLPCEECGKAYPGDCPVHGPLTRLEDAVVPAADARTSAHAALTVPADTFMVAASGIPDAGLGVWARRPVPNRTLMGPYKGEVIAVARTPRYSWQIKRGSHVVQFVDAGDPRQSNWLRFVNCSRHESEENLLAFQWRGEIYYRTRRCVAAHEELLLWYGRSLALDVGVPANKYRWPLLHPLPVNSFECDVCDLSFASPIYLENHRTTKHFVHLRGKTRKGSRANSDSNMNGTSVGNHSYDSEDLQKQLDSNEPNSYDQSCSVLAVQNGGVSDDLSQSENNNQQPDPAHQTLERAFKCKVCCASFRDGQALNEHRRMHQYEKRFECEYCDKRFRDAWGMNIHRRTHTGERPFKCEVCPKKYPTRNKLKIHTRIHTGERPFRCSVCSRTFISSTSLRDHRRVHSGDYRCEVCNVEFRSLFSLKKHKFDHLKDKPRPHDSVNGDCCQLSRRSSTASSSSSTSVDSITHIQQRYGVLKRKHINNKLYLCNLCSKILRMHNRQYTEIPPVEALNKMHVCAICTTGFHIVGKFQK